MGVVSVQESRRQYIPSFPAVLSDVTAVDCVEDRPISIEEGLSEIFPRLSLSSVVRCISSPKRVVGHPVRIGVLLSGGPAPGGHNVIAGLYDAMMEWHSESSLIGFLDGPKGLVQNRKKRLTAEEIDAVRNCGGFELLGTGRGAMQSSEELAAAVRTIEAEKLNAVVVIGGDDSNTDAAFLANKCAEMGLKTSIIGVPKTIDGDLQSEDISISFGFDTACSVYSEIIGNIARDILSTKKYYFFIRLMGRVASHITLECALRIHPNMALISEEISAKASSIQEVVAQIADLVEDRLQEGKQYGLVLVPEGVIEQFADISRTIEKINDLFALPSSVQTRLQECVTIKERLDLLIENLDDESRACFVSFPTYMKEELICERDPHGNVHVSKIETERLLAHLVAKELEHRSVEQRRQIPFSVQTEFCGYEGRCAYPSNFDCNYCYALGRLALTLAIHGKNGYMTAIRHLHKEPKEWSAVGVPLVSLMHFEHRLGRAKAVIRKTKVDIHAQPFSYFAHIRKVWRLEDDYIQPGPMQFTSANPSIFLRE
jgi:diphosphate-dependent phosphofructokinase